LGGLAGRQRRDRVEGDPVGPVAVIGEQRRGALVHGLPLRSAGASIGQARRRLKGRAGGQASAGTYWATPLPNDQFSGATSTRLMNTSCGRRPGRSASRATRRR